MIDAARPTRTLANAVIIEGLFALMWFSWGQAGPPAWESTMRTVGAVLAVLVAIGGVLRARRARPAPSPRPDRAARRSYGLIVGTEFASIGAGAAILGATGHDELIAVWVCLVVGVHFLPLDRVFPGLGLARLAAATTCVAVAASIVGASTSIAAATVATLGAGICLLGHAAWLQVVAAPATSR